MSFRSPDKPPTSLVKVPASVKKRAASPPTDDDAPQAPAKKVRVAALTAESWPDHLEEHSFMWLSERPVSKDLFFSGTVAFIANWTEAASCVTLFVPHSRQV